MKIIKFWYPPNYEIIIADDPKAQDKKDIFLDSVRSGLSKMAHKTMMLMNLGYIETPSGKQEITKETLDKIKIIHKDVNDISPFHTFQMRQIKVGSYIYSTMQYMYRIDTVVRGTEAGSAILSFEEFIQNIILENLMKLTSEVLLRTRPADEELEEEEEPEPPKEKQQQQKKQS